MPSLGVLQALSPILSLPIPSATIYQLPKELTSLCNEYPGGCNLETLNMYLGQRAS